MKTWDRELIERQTRMRSRARAARCLGAAALLAGLPAAAAAQTVESRTTHIVEWNLPAMADASPGAMVVDTRGEDNGRVWFVTRLGVQRVYRLDPHHSLMKGNANWTSWDLAEDSITTGGTRKIRASHDRRYVFVRTAQSLQRIDTQSCDNASPRTCERIEWIDQPGQFSVSDLTVDDYNKVLTTAAVGAPPPGELDLSGFDPSQSYVQMLTPASVPNNTTTTATVKRWVVGGGAGFCADLGRTTTSLPCISGIDVHPGNKDNKLVYYSEPQGGPDGRGAIGELNIQTNNVRRWAFATLPPDADGGIVQQPRQLHIDRFGKVWVITGSGHLVSLDPCTNKMTRHAMPNAVLADPFGLAPDDDVVGYTDAGVSTARVGMLLPSGTSIYVAPTSTNIPPTTVSITAMGERATVGSGTIQPEGFVVPATVTTKSDGVFVEAMIGGSGGHDSESPLGITANRGKGQGTFFYAVGLPGEGSVDRVGFVRLPMPKKPKHPRDDDDPEDGNDHNVHAQGWHTHQPSDGADADDDGLGPEFDLPTTNEAVEVGEPVALNAGQFTDYTMTTSPTSLALIGSVVSVDPTSILEVDVYNALGALVASQSGAGAAAVVVPLPAAGNYTIRVRNLGLGALTQTPMLIVREPGIQ